jgi:hypothetical protein
LQTLVSWKKRKELEKINHLGPKRPLSSFGPDVVGLQWLVASIDVGVGMGVVKADGDRVVVVVEGIVVNGGGGLCIRAGFKRTIKNEKLKWEWKWWFLWKQGKGLIFQKWSFLGSFLISFWCSFSKKWD